MSVLLLEHLQRERAAALETAVDLAASGGTIDTIRVAAGGVRFIDSLWGKLHPSEPEADEPEEAFEDPGKIRRPE